MLVCLLYHFFWRGAYREKLASSSKKRPIFGLFQFPWLSCLVTSCVCTYIVSWCTTTCWALLLCHSCSMLLFAVNRLAFPWTTTCCSDFRNTSRIQKSLFRSAGLAMVQWIAFILTCFFHSDSAHAPAPVSWNEIRLWNASVYMVTKRLKLESLNFRWTVPKCTTCSTTKFEGFLSTRSSSQGGVFDFAALNFRNGAKYRLRTKTRW